MPPLPNAGAGGAPSLGRGFARRHARAPELSAEPDRLAAEARAQDLQQQQERTTQTGLRTRGHGATVASEEAHAALSWSVHDVFGNSVMQGALSGRLEGPGQAIEGAMTLGAAGVAVAEDVGGLLSNSSVMGWLAEGGAGAAADPGAADGALDGAVSRRSTHGQEQFGDEAGARLQTALGRGGRPMPAQLAARMGAAFGGVDFSGVRIHTDGAAAQAAEAIRAHAFATGTDIYFNRGAWSPETPAGQHLLAHELTHVVQHMEGRLRPGGGEGLDVSSPTDPHELEAEARASEVTRALSSGSVDAALQDASQDAQAAAPAELALEAGAAVAEAGVSAEAPAIDGAESDAGAAAGPDAAVDGVHRRARPGGGGGGRPSAGMRSGGGRPGGGAGAGARTSGGGRSGGRSGGERGGGGGRSGGMGDLIDGGMGIVSELLGQQDPAADQVLGTLRQVLGGDLSIDGDGIEGLTKTLAAAMGATAGGVTQTRPGGTGVGEGPTGPTGGSAPGGGSPSANASWSVKKGSAGANRGEGSGAGVRLEGDPAAYTRDLLQTVVEVLGTEGTLDPETVWSRMQTRFPDQVDPQQDVGIEGRANADTGMPNSTDGARPDGPQGEQISGGFRGGGDTTRRGAADSEGFDPMQFAEMVVGQFNTLNQGDMGPLVQQVLQGELARLVPGFGEMLGQRAGQDAVRGGGGASFGMGGVSGMVADAMPGPMGGPGDAVAMLGGGVPAPAIGDRMADRFGGRGGGPGGPGGPGGGPGSWAPGYSNGARTARGSNSQVGDWANQPGGVTPRGSGGPRRGPRGEGQEERRSPRPQGPEREEGGGGPGLAPTGGEEEQAPTGPTLAPTGPTQAPTQAPSGGSQDTAVAASGGASREVDGLVDYYMETHWDRSEFDSKVSEYGVLPEQLGTELDQWMPAQTPEGVRSGLNLAFGIGGGLLDAVFSSVVKAIPVAGVVAHVAYGIKDIWSAHETYKDVEGGRGAWLYAVNIVRDIANMVGGTAGNLADACTILQDALIASVIGAELAPIPAAIGEVLTGIAWGCDGAKVIFDGVSAVLNIMEANEAERQGDFRRAAKHRDLARGDVMTGIVDTIGLIASTVSALSANTVPGEMPENLAEGVKNLVQSPAFSVNTFLAKTPGKMQSGALGISSRSRWSTAKAQSGRILTPAGQTAGLTQSWNNLMYQVGLGDAMLLSNEGLFGGHYIEPGSLSGNGSVTGPMSTARQASVQQFQAAWGELEGNDPTWYQKMINDVLSGGKEASALDMYSAALTPSTWIKGFFKGMRFVDTLIDDSTKEAAAGSLRALASGIETIARPGIDAINGIIDEVEPGLDEMLRNMGDAIAQQRVSLEGVRETVSSVQELTTWVSQLADEHGAIDQSLDEAISKIDNLRITREDLSIPDWVPEFTYSWAIDAINSGVDGLKSGAQSLKDGSLEQIDQFIDQLTEWAQTQLAEIQAAIAEGGELEMMMQQSYDEFAAGAQAMTQAIADWDMGIHLDLEGTVAWLGEMASKVESTESGARLDQFKAFLQGEAQAYVDAWKAEHEDAVNQAYYPEVPAAEVSAANAAWSAVNARLSELEAQGIDVEDSRDAATEAWAEIQANVGAKGQDALNGFWSGADALARVAASLGL